VFCAIVGDGAAFSVRVEKAEWEDEDGYLVEDLKEVVKAQSRGTITVASSRLRLFLAKKGERWLTNSDTPAVKLDTDRQPVAVEEDGSTHPFVKMDETVDVLFYFGKDFERKSGEVHVLVVVPVQERHLLELWRVSGSIENALSTKGIRCRVVWRHHTLDTTILRVARGKRISRSGTSARRCAFMYCSRQVSAIFLLSRCIVLLALTNCVPVPRRECLAVRQRITR